MTERVYTLGYATWTLDEVVAEVRRLDAWLVDIRMKPQSRKPGFSLSALLQAGIHYAHLPAFGNVNYARGGMVELADPERGIEEIRPLLRRRPVVLMCGCKDLQTCHRRQVAELVEAQLGVEVEHL